MSDELLSGIVFQLVITNRCANILNGFKELVCPYSEKMVNIIKEIVEI